MIGVIAESADYPVVREFFELFKTPWEFFQKDGNYEVLLCAGAELKHSSARLVLVYGSPELPFDQKAKLQIRMQTASRMVSFGIHKFPLYGSSATFRASGNQALVDAETQAPVSQSIESTDQVVVRIGYDLFQEIRRLLTRGQPSMFATIPALELHIEFLRRLIVQQGIPLVEIPPVPEGYNFVACLTHDVDHVGIRNHKFDHTMWGFLYRAFAGSVSKLFNGRLSVRQAAANWTAALKLPFVHLGLAKDFWFQFDHYLQLEQGVNSTFFVVPFKGRAGMGRNGSKPATRATRYDISDIPEEIQKLTRSEREIGLHGVDAWIDSHQGTVEQQKIAEVTGAEPAGVRMHWLCFDEGSHAILEAAGFDYDSTIGYNECIGYKAGTGQVYRPLGVSHLLELPMHIMDTALFYPKYMDLSPREAEGAMMELVEQAVRFGGTLTINWHDRSIAPERLWGEPYVKLLGALKNKGAWFPTARQAVSWFEMRRAATFENAPWQEGNTPVKLAVDPARENLPGLRLRFYNSYPQTDNGMALAKQSDAFVDVPLNRANNHTLVLTN